MLKYTSDLPGIQTSFYLVLFFSPRHVVSQNGSWTFFWNLPWSDIPLNPPIDKQSKHGKKQISFNHKVINHPRNSASFYHKVTCWCSVTENHPSFLHCGTKHNNMCGSSTNSLNTLAFFFSVLITTTSPCPKCTDLQLRHWFTGCFVFSSNPHSLPS